MGNFDLYGNHYATRQEAEIAEMAQCNEIDNAHNRKAIQRMERELQRQRESEHQDSNQHLHERIGLLEARIERLESLLIK